MHRIPTFPPDMFPVEYAADSPAYFTGVNLQASPFSYLYHLLVILKVYRMGFVSFLLLSLSHEKANGVWSKWGFGA